MQKFPVYLDFNATNPMDPEVLQAMLPWFIEKPGNAGSRTHLYGQEARDAVENARKHVAAHFRAKPEEIVFTSGATESNNLLLLGLVSFANRTGKNHIISTSIEHKAILEPLQVLKKLGFEIDLVDVTAEGVVNPADVLERIRKNTLLVSVMHANNETGVLQPVEDISRLAASNGVLFHTDAAQTFGKEAETLASLDCDFASISAHKICGPKGVGALLARRRGNSRAIEPIQFGGGQEWKLRPGTLPVPQIVGFGKAAELAASHWRERKSAATRIKETLLELLVAHGAIQNGSSMLTQSHVINVSIPGIDSEAFMMATKNIVSVSNGSACTSSAYQPSHVLTAMGLDEDRVSSAIRFSWGPGVDQVPTDELDHVLRRIA